MPEIYEITTPAGPALVKAETKQQAVGFARRGIVARRLSGGEVLALPLGADILDARESDAEAAGESDGHVDGGEG